MSTVILPDTLNKLHINTAGCSTRAASQAPLALEAFTCKEQHSFPWQHSKKKWICCYTHKSIVGEDKNCSIYLGHQMFSSISCSWEIARECWSSCDDGKVLWGRTTEAQALHRIIEGFQMSNEPPSLYTITTNFWHHATQKATSCHSVWWFRPADWGISNE